MKKEITILHIEDEEQIVQIVQKILQKDGLRVNSIQVQTKSEFLDALKNNEIDLVIADYSLPEYNGLSALRLLRERDTETPFILFSGSIGEEKAIASLREGATDYVLKENIKALEPVVIRVLKESALRKKQQESQRALEQSKQTLNLIMDKLPIGVLLIDRESQKIVDINPKASSVFGSPREKIIGNICHNYICPKAQGNCPIIDLGQEVDNSEKIVLTAEKEEIPVLKSVVPIMVDDRPHLLESFVDISQQKKMESTVTSFGRILDDSLNEIYIFDAGTLKFVKLNRGAKENIGYSENESYELTPLDIKPEFTFQTFTEKIKPLREGIKNKISFTTIHKRKNGSTYPVEVSLQLTVFNEKPVFIAIISDISERVRSEKIRQVMFEISAAHLKTLSENDFYVLVQQQLSTLLDTSNFIIAMYDNQTDTLSLKYMQDKMDRIEDFANIPAKGSLSSYVIKQQKAMRFNESEMKSFLKKEKIKGVGTLAKSWLGVPLVVDNESIGLMIVQSYERSDLYDEDDLYVMEFIAGQLAESIKRKQIESKMYQLSRSLEQSPVSTVITDLNGTIQYVNPKFSQVTGYSEEEAIGQNPRILKSGEMRHEEYKELWDTIKNGHVWRGRFHNRRKNGTFFWEDATIGPIKNDKGEITHFLAVKEDISEWVETEENMERLNQQNDTLLATFPSILMVMNAEEQVIRWNQQAAEVFNLDWQQVRHQQFHSLPIDWAWGDIVDGISMCRDQKKIIHLTDVSFERKDDVSGFLNVSIAPFTDEESILDGYLIHAEDITEKKIAEGQQAHTQKLESIGQLAAGIAHEINTPTQYIGDNTHFLKDSFDDLNTLFEVMKQMQNSAEDPDQLSELLNKAGSIADEIDLEFLMDEIPTAIEQSLDGIGKVSKIVKAMKEFSHPGSKDKTLVDLNRAIQNTITVSRNEWKYVADVKTEFDETLTEVPCFHDEFNQVILNIIINAAHAIGDSIKEGDPKGTITVQTFRREKAAEIRLMDTGTGIPESIIEKIFDPFFTTKEVGKGTGQGLAISYDVIVNKHKGALQVESEPGKGTTFIIRLPLDEEKKEQEA